MEATAKTPLSCNPTFKKKWKSLSRVWLLQPHDNAVSGILQVRILEWVAVPFSKVSSQPRDWTQVFSSAGGFFSSWATNNPSHKDMILILVLEGVFVTFDSCACHVSE